MRISLLALLFIALCANGRAQVDDWNMTKEQEQEFAEYQERIDAIRDISKLTNERRTLIRKIMQLKSEHVSAEAQVVGLKTSIEEIRSRLASMRQDKERLKFYENDLQMSQEKLALLHRSGKPDNQSEQEYSAQIAKTLELIDNTKEMIAQQNRIQIEKARLESKLAELEPKLVLANQELSRYQDSNIRLQDELEIVEDKINVMLIPTTAENEFKLWVTIAFTSLVGLVILGFFIVSSGDREVRRAIFSSQSGIQFITLFSLVIAIILFGITEILGAKELAALLGGISGYILGRVSDGRMRGGCQGGYVGGAGPRGGRFSQEGTLSPRSPSGLTGGGRLSQRSSFSQRERGVLSQRERPARKEGSDDENSEDKDN